MKMWGKKWGGHKHTIAPPKQKRGGGTCPPCPPASYASVYIYIYIVEEGLDGHGLLLLRVSRVMRSSELSDDRITRETLSNNNPCPSSPSSTILRSAYMALNTLQQDWLL